MNKLHPEVRPAVIAEYKRLLLKFPTADKFLMEKLARDFVYDIALADTLLWKQEMLA
jgi:hypothetical protein